MTDHGNKPVLARPKPGLGSVVLLLFRILAGGLFIFAAAIKLDDPAGFSEAISGFKVIPEGAEHLNILATFVVPWLELISGICLVLGLWTRASATIVVVMLLGFCGLIYSAIYREMELTCGCFGKIDFVCDGPLGWCSIIRNGVHAAVALVPLIAGSGLLGLDALGWKPERPSPDED